MLTELVKAMAEAAPERTVTVGCRYCSAPTELIEAFTRPLRHWNEWNERRFHVREDPIVRADVMVCASHDARWRTEMAERAASEDRDLARVLDCIRNRRPFHVERWMRRSESIMIEIRSAQRCLDEGGKGHVLG